MIRKLRWKFVAINMAIVTLLLVAICAFMFLTLTDSLRDDSLSVLRRVIDQKSVSVTVWGEDGTVAGESFWSKTPFRDQEVSLPYFTVAVGRDGEAVVVDSKFYDVNDEDALLTVVREGLAAKGETGLLRSYHLRYLRKATATGWRIAFTDISQEQSTTRNLLINMLLIVLSALVGFFFISLLLARWAIRPVERSWKQQRQFVADASHELKTPLTVILANTGIVLSHKENTVSSQAKWLEYTREEAARMKGLVDDLLFLAKSDDARRTTRPLEVSLSELALGCLLPFESVAFEAGVSLESAIAPGVSVLGDEGQLRRLVMILLDNAVKYAGSGGRAALTLVRQQDKVRLTVHNTGAPIPAEHLPHLFERFYRVDAARDRAQGGYGLGLAIAKSVAETHHGKITVSSSAGTGTCFTVVLPRK